jgi:hypothetical protein
LKKKNNNKNKHHSQVKPEEKGRKLSAKMHNKNPTTVLKRRIKWITL